MRHHAMNWSLLFAAGLFGLAHGADWSYTGEGAWTSPGNWKEGIVPAATVDVTNNVGGTMVVSDGMDITAKLIRCGSVSGKNGKVRMTGGHLKLTDVATTIGSAAGGTGSFDMSGGLLETSQFQIGASGTGTMTLSGGVVTNTNWSCIGRYAGGVGTMTITGAGRWVNANGACTLFVSEQGSGTLTIENGGEYVFTPGNTSGVILANQATGVGTLHLKTGGLIEANYVNVKTAPSAFILDGGTLRRVSSADYANFIMGAGTFKIGAAGGTIDTGSGTQTVALGVDNAVENPGQLVKVGTGKLILSGYGDFTGGYDIQSGTLSAASPLNLPGFRTAPVTIAAGATLALGSSWDAASVEALTNRADFVVAEGGQVTWTPSASGDWVADVPNNTKRTIGPGVETTQRLVKTNSGTLVLQGANSFGSVAVSNGYLRADNLADNVGHAHVDVYGATAGAPACLGTGDTVFAPTLGSTGADTVSFARYAGIYGWGNGLTVNFGGAGAEVKAGQDGFNITDLALKAASGTVTLVNPLNLNAKSPTLKGGTSSTLVLAGGITNNSTSAGSLYYWDGNLVIPRRANNAAHVMWHFNPRSGNILVTNAIVRMASDTIVGDTGSNSGKAVVTYKDCDKFATSGWDYINGTTGTVLVVDGGTWKTAGELRIGSGVQGRTGELVITNGAAVTVGNVFRMFSGKVRQSSGTFAPYQLLLGQSAAFPDATYELSGGAVTPSSGEQHVGSVSNANARLVMTGGRLYFKDSLNFQVGARGKGLFHQTGGTVSANQYPCVGRYASGTGTYRLHGGVFAYRGTSGLPFIAEEGTGIVSVANGGCFIISNNFSCCLGSKAKSSGRMILSPDGLVECARFYGGSGASSFVFNGGTWRRTSASYLTGFLPTSVKKTVVTPYGGAFDTNGKGDFAFDKALTAATDAADLAEALAHRWTFDGGSLKDTVGTSDAAAMGTVAYTNDALRLVGGARGASCVNLGTDLLPTDGRGATLEFVFTPNAHGNWARIFNFGSGSKGECYYSFNSNTTGVPFFYVNGASSAYMARTLVVGTRYHLAVTFDPQLDGTWIVAATLSDPATGARLDYKSFRTATSFSLAKIAQSEGCWLGHSTYTADKDPAADYHDVRIHHRVLTADQIAASARNGADHIYAFRKQGAGKLTMTGANTYTCGTAVDAGTLALADGAVLPATDWLVAADATLQLNATAQTARSVGGTGTVKGGSVTVTDAIHPGGIRTIGTLTLDGAEVTGGTLVADIAADGICDKLVSTGTLDVSTLGFRIADPTMLDEKRVYTVASAPEITGTFSEVDIPNRWRLHVNGTRVSLAYDNGTVLLIR